MDALWSLVLIAAGVAVIAGSRRLATMTRRRWRDGRSFNCTLADLGPNGTMGTWEEALAEVVDGTVAVTGRGRHRTHSDGWCVLQRAASPPRGRAVYLVRRDDALMALSVRAGSIAERQLDALSPRS